MILPRSSSSGECSANGFCIVPMVQTTVAACSIVPSVSTTPLSSTAAALALIRTSTPRSASERCAASAEPRGQFGQKAVDVLQQGHLHFARRNARIVGDDVAQAVGERAGRFHTRKPAADHEEVTELLSQQLIGLELDAREPAQNEIAQVRRVADRLERNPVLGHARNHVEARPVAEREHDVLVRKQTAPASVSQAIVRAAKSMS